MQQRRLVRSPRRKWLTRQWSHAKKDMQQAVEEHGREIKAAFDDVVSDWSDASRPQFVLRVAVNSKEIRVTVQPRKRRKASTIFGYVDRGTHGPYPIRPKKTNKTGRLAFRTGYQPKTLPIARAHVGPGLATGPWRRPTAVQHPGIKARRFSETIQKQTRPRFQRRVESAFRNMERQMRQP